MTVRIMCGQNGSSASLDNAVAAGQAREFRPLLADVLAKGEDFEWYPTSDRMIAAVSRRIPTNTASILDIGAGDGRVLLALAKRCERPPVLYAIEKSSVLIQAQPESVVPVGTDFHQENLACLPADVIFCNPPYTEYAEWTSAIIEAGYAKIAFLVVPRRWKDDATIAAAIARRGATVKVLSSDDFKTGADRSARAVIDILEVRYPRTDDGYRDDAKDPFDIWFDQNISNFDTETSDIAQQESERLHVAHLRTADNIGEFVREYDVEFQRMEENYRAIFRLDAALLRELGVKKNEVREGIKKKMACLKAKYWALLFDRLDSITERLSTATRAKFLKRLTAGDKAIAFTSDNAYAIVIWAIKNANAYFDEQTVQLYRDLATFDGVANYKSNLRTWTESDWRYRRDDDTDGRPSHYALDYRIVVSRYQAIAAGEWRYEFQGDLHRRCHELIADVIAVLGNLGFRATGQPSIQRQWRSGEWQDWHLGDSDDVLVQVKAYKNGNLHLRFRPAAIRALNVEAGRLLGWLNSPHDVESELGYTAEEATALYRSTRRITVSAAMPLLAAPREGGA
jgi:hypothetical protein